MTKQQALEVAKTQFAAYQKADIEHLFRGAPEPVKSDYGYRHGWIIVGGYSFNGRPDRRTL